MISATAVGIHDPDEERKIRYEQYTSSDVTLPEHLLFQLQFCVPSKKACRIVGRYIIESLDENGYMTLTVEEMARGNRGSGGKVRGSAG